MRVMHHLAGKRGQKPREKSRRDAPLKPPRQRVDEPHRRRPEQNRNQPRDPHKLRFGIAQPVDDFPRAEHDIFRKRGVIEIRRVELPFSLKRSIHAVDQFIRIPSIRRAPRKSRNSQREENETQQKRNPSLIFLEEFFNREKHTACSEELASDSRCDTPARRSESFLDRKALQIVIAKPRRG